MASEMKAILTRSKDWEKWFWQLQANISNKIWPFIDSDSEELDLVKAPKCVKLTDFEMNMTLYALLSAANQKFYNNTHYYYDQDKKYYSWQEDQLQVV